MLSLLAFASHARQIESKWELLKVPRLNLKCAQTDSFKLFYYITSVLHKEHDLLTVEQLDERTCNIFRASSERH